MENNVLIIVDMQNDFLTGALPNIEAQKIVPDMVNYINQLHDCYIILTRDSHDDNYMDSAEGKFLPIEHCIRGTEGWCVTKEIRDAVAKAVRDESKKCSYTYLDKKTFGCGNDSVWNYIMREQNPSSITLVGTCTDICVISNAMILRAIYPDAQINIIATLCAGTSKESHECALSAMEKCNIKVVRHHIEY